MVFVQDFGAVGDGVTDDGPALQAAIDRLGLAGGSVILGLGHYAVLSQPIRLPSNVVLTGEGPGIYVYGQHPRTDERVPCTALFSPDSAGLPWIVEIVGPEENKHIWAAGLRDLAIRNLGGGGLLIRNAIEVDLDRLSFNSCLTDGMRVENERSYDINIRSCQFINNQGWGINLDPGGTDHGPDRVRIFNSYMINNWLGQLRVILAQNVVLRDSSFLCSIDRIAPGWQSVGVYAFAAHALVVDGCYSENLPVQAIILDGDGDSVSPYGRATAGAAIRSNYMVGMSQYSPTGVIELRRATGCHISNNVILARGTHAMPVVYFGADARRNIVQWNEFYRGGWKSIDGQRYYDGPGLRSNLIWHFHDVLPAALGLGLPLPEHAHPLPEHAHPLPEHAHPLPEHEHPLPDHAHPLPEHAHPLPEHEHPLPDHAHPLPEHEHPLPEHEHPLPEHEHPLPEHEHPLPEHEHPLPEHEHPLPEHEHPLPEHEHPLPEHEHPLPEHEHPLPEHEHPLPEHEHPLPEHTHPLPDEV